MPVNDRILDLMDEGFRSDGRYGVVKGVDGDKKKAADSLSIEKVTGEDSQRIYGDYDNFNRKRKSELGQTLVEDDQWLLQYVRNNPLASTVSKDDWGNLSNFTQSVKSLTSDSTYFMKGFVSQLTKENPELVAEFMEGMSYHMPSALQPSMLSASRSIRDLSSTIKPEGYERTTSGMFDISSVGDAYAWGMETLGSGLASMLPALAVGGAGAAAGAGVAGPPGALVGGLAGAGSASYAMGYGEVYKALKDEKVEPAQAAMLAAVAAVPIAALDMASLGTIVTRFGGAAAVKRELSRSMAKRIAKEMAAGATTESITEGLQEIVKDATVSIGADKEFGTTEQMKGWIENAVAGGMVGGVATGAAGLRGKRPVEKAADQSVKTIENGELWLKTGQAPPVGVDPFIDQAIALDSQRRIEILDGIMENADKTETKELSPESWSNLTNIVFGSQYIEIRWPAVKALYGDKMPMADDGMLGFATDIGKQFVNSNLTGESVKVKLADWVGKVDPEINKLLHDDLAFPDGMTINEVKSQPTLEQVSTISEVPETAFPPLAQELDKPYSLSKGVEGKYDILDENGNKAAGVRITEREGGKNLFVHFEEGQVDVAGLRTLMRQLKEQYPEAETITSPKVPGVESLRRDLQGSNITVDIPFRIKESAADIVRRSAALEPLFDLPREGPRALRIIPGRLGVGLRPIRGARGFTVTDEIGQHVADLELSYRASTGDISIDWIGPKRDPYGRAVEDIKGAFGPKLIRSLITELQKQFPEAKTISGFRVSGAREAAMKEAKVSISLKALADEIEKAPAGWEAVEPLGPETQKLVDLTQGWAQFGGDLIAQRQRVWTPEEMALERAIDEGIRKLVGEMPRVYGAEDIRLGKEQRRVHGVFQMYNDRAPLIIWSLEAEDPMGTARHEAIHFLRQYGYLSKEEWAILEKYAEENGLIERHGVDSRYSSLDREGQLEEAIADEFRIWRREPKSDHPGAKVFQKIKDILERIKSALREALGRDPTLEDIFGKIEKGEVAERGPGELVEPRAFIPKAEEERLVPPIEPEGVPTFEPGAIMDKARYAKYQRLINMRNQEDAEKELGEAKREIKRRESPEWKKQFDEMMAKVTTDIANRPDWKVSQFFRNGMFFGMDSKYRPKIDPKYLTPEQRKSFPKQFMTKGGMDPDALAGSFGYSTGEYMIDKMIEFEQAKGELGPKEFFEKMVKEETNRRMELEHGKLAENILKEAMDHVVGSTQMDLLHEETMALAERAGQALPLSKEDMRATTATQFHGEVASGVSMRGYFREMYRAGKAAELAFLKGDWIEAFRQKQSQVRLFALAEHAKKFEKTQRKFDSIIKEFNKRDIDVKKIPPEYAEWIHSILFRIGRPPKRLPEDLQRMIATRDHQDLRSFYEDKNKFPVGNEQFETEVNPNLVIWDKLMDDPNKTWDFGSLTVGEVQALNDSLQSLKKIGRDEGKYIRAGEAMDLKDLKKNMDNQLSKLGPKREPMKGGIRHSLQWMQGGLMQLEAMFDRWDRGNQRGIFTRMFSFPLTAASNALSTMQRQYASKLVEIDKKFGLKGSELRDKVENDVFYEPIWMDKDEKGKPIVPAEGKNWMQMTREHVRGVLLNWGNPSNRKRLAEGYNTTEGKIQAWLDKVATKRDWDWAREIGRVYEEIQKESDEMTFRMSGTLVEMLPLPKIQSIHGEYDGWYYPIIYDRSREGGPRLKAEQPPPTVARTYTGWERKRTGSAGPLDLTLGEMGNFISRRLKDNAFREVLHNVHKIWSDKEFRASVTKYYGHFAVQMLDKAYNDFAGHTGLTSGIAKSGDRFAELIRQNTIGALIAFNPGTVMKHGPTAFMQSWKEAGIFKGDFYKAMLGITNPVTMMENLNFMFKGKTIGDLDWAGSAELQRRHQHWAETIGGAGDIQMRRMNLREQFLYYGSYPVAWSDMVSSTILWKAKYDRIMSEIGHSMPIEQAHMEAVQMADYAIRRTHGSTAITSRPEFMRTQHALPRYLTSLYGFFNHIYNRFYRMGWKAKDLIQETGRGEKTLGEFMKGSADLTGDFMMYIVVPSVIEAIVVEGLLSSDWDDMGWGELLGKGMIHTTAASIPIVRDIIHATTTGHDPSAGLLGATIKSATDFYRQMDPSKEVWDTGKIIQTSNTLLGVAVGMSSTQIGRWERFLWNYTHGEETPADPADWYRAFRTGTTLPRRH